ncbi:MAG: NUDIX domain-containing protein [Hamadaea sp.]|uniref:NUDIX hydrolase n=1 Tax=Hamadaea sp. TaxID=2024425 RepID=UPI001794695D|nr:NUDIX domain-containing protein [Hamadaea sp.]NUR72171.1 NUDIX domain-containing protein [Hamadaea sp.]NUT22738.1 NUDIX domain-containing protein [Hamadaea sp.]
MTDGEIKIRRSARVLLLDADDRVLLLKIHDPSAVRGPNPLPSVDFWLLVGGGLEQSETYEEAARREVFEETGISDFTLGRCILRHDKVVENPYGELQHVYQQIFVGRVPSGVPVSFAGHEPLEASTTIGYAWFTHAEMLDRERHETFVPLGLSGLFAEALLR